MAKIQKSFFCQNCGSQSTKWIGKCPNCGEWNTYVEEIVHKDKPQQKGYKAGSTKEKVVSVPIKEVTAQSGHRIVTPDAELNRVLGSGIMPGSLVLLGGEPGIGKSTLLLQMALNSGYKILYVSGEESAVQIKNRADRIGIANENCYVFTETGLDEIFTAIKDVEPDIVVIDSVQTLHSSLVDSTPGSISQIKECAGELLRFAKETHTPVFLIGHITKDGAIAGPKVLEHMVDTVLQFEGDRHNTYRLLRTTKNRFGNTSELGIYEMVEAGLREVSNPSEILISQKDDNLSGIAICASLEGARPLLIETQALVSTAVYGTPQRNSNGFDLRRLNMLLAVLEKRCGFRLGVQDVFINIAGGLKIEDPGTDLAIVSAILSSYEDIAIPHKTAFAAEVGLSGEIRAVTRIEQRISEAEKLGFDRIFISKFNQKGLEMIKPKIKIEAVGKVEEAFELLFG
ncbi:DNA repair protein RadA [Oscillatoria amoena NRMC-F 0135]|jgi:DNA repair protein RadA/Sms|nr:MAG: DNA repair protein RadA [Bacteroidota bacterium]MDL5048459.1 DNA repair protein RadA [Oscillatoria amoena NRMC-F 0135]